MPTFTQSKARVVARQEADYPPFEERIKLPYDEQRKLGLLVLGRRWLGHVPAGVGKKR